MRQRLAVRVCRPRALYITALAVAVVLLAACGEDSQPVPPGFSVVQPVSSVPIELAGEGDTAVPQPDSQARPGGALGFSHFAFEDLGGEVIATLVEGPVGEQVRTNLSYLQLKLIYNEGGPPPEELRMTREELGELVGQLDTVRRATGKYKDVQVALDDGYQVSPEQFPNMGAHFVNPFRILDGVFNPEEPEFLLYIRDEAEAWELVGTGFLLPTQLVGEDHPGGFAGPLDNWHVHYSLCLGGNSRSRSATQAECKKQEGTWVPSFGWMIHSYVWVDNPLGVFGMWNPNIPPVMPAEDIRQARTLDDVHEGELATTIENFGHRSSQVQVGETLVWTNMDGVPHTVTLGFRGVAEPGFDSGLMGPGQSFAVKFDQPGAYSFTCTLHPAMNGEIVVIE